MVKLFSLLKKQNKKVEFSYKDEAFKSQAREQFKKLVDKGLELPVVLL